MGGVRLRRTGSMLFRVKRLLKSGMFEEPAWVKAMEDVPPMSFPKAPKPEKLVFPETQLVSYYLKTHPEALKQPIRLSGPVPSVALRFAWRQMELVEEQGLSKAAAAEIVQQEFIAKANQESEGEEVVSVLKEVQMHEGEELHAAMQRLSAKSGK